MPKINLGWLKDKNGEKFAPKTITTQVISETGKNLEDRLENYEKLLKEKIDLPLTAEVGQQLIVKAIDDNGRPTDWECIERPCAYLGDEFITLLNEDVNFTEAHIQAVHSCHAILDDIVLEDGCVYNVEYNGVLYESLVCVKDRMGESSDDAFNWKDNNGRYHNYPFYIIYNKTYNMSTIYLCGERTSRTEHFKLEKKHSIYVKLDNNYLQENIPKIKSAEVGQLLLVTGVDENGIPNSFGVITNDFVQISQYATNSRAGIVKASNSYGVAMSAADLQVYKASTTDIASKTHNYRPIVPSNLDYAVKQGLINSKIAWTDLDKEKARNMIGVIQSDWAQYNDSAPDFIKNKPFYYTEKNVQGELQINIGGIATERTTIHDETLYNLLLTNNVGNIKIDGNKIQFKLSDNDKVRYDITNMSPSLMVYKDAPKVCIMNTGSFEGTLGTGTMSYAYSTSELKQLDEKFIPNNIPKINSASIGQAIVVDDVDENGKPIKWKAVDKANELQQATSEVLGGIKADVKTDNYTVDVKIGEDGKLYVPEYPKEIEVQADSELSEESTNPIQNKVVAKQFAAFSGTVEVTSGEPTKEKTVMTFNPDAEDIHLYTAEEIDAMFGSYALDVANLIGGIE